MQVWDGRAERVGATIAAQVFKQPAIQTLRSIAEAPLRVIDASGERSVVLGQTPLWAPRMIVPFDHDDPSIVGKKVLIGVTYFDADGHETSRGQWWGTVLAFNLRQGLLVDLADSGKPHMFPPLPDAFRLAESQTYTLQSTGEVVERPDFLYVIRSNQRAR